MREHCIRPSPVGLAAFAYTRFIDASEVYFNSFVLQAVHIAIYCLRNNIAPVQLDEAKLAMLNDEKRLQQATDLAIRFHAASSNSRAPIVEVDDTRRIVNLDFSYANLYMRQVPENVLSEFANTYAKENPGDEVLKEQMEGLISAYYDISHPRHPAQDQ